jgi:hypothetical protein
MFVAPSAQQQKSSPFPLAGYAMAGGMLGLGRGFTMKKSHNLQR